MEQLIPRTLKRWESYQSSLAKSAVFTQLQNMTKGQLDLRIKGDAVPYSFGYGNKVKAVISIENERFFHRFWSNGELGFGASYVEGDWNSPDLAQVIRWFFFNVDQIESFVRPEDAESPFMQFMLGMRYIQDVIGRRSPAFGYNGPWATQFELERPFFQLMLDKGLHNSGGLFEPGDTLAEAQERKVERIARELRIRDGQKILELGCGWGSLAIAIAERYNCHVTAVTLAEEQHLYLVEQIRTRGLEGRITPVHADYRSVDGLFDRIVSVELIDVIEPANLPEFFGLCDSWLTPQGLMVHQVLLTPETLRPDAAIRNEWNQTYISPGLSTPSLAEILYAMNETSSFCIRNFLDMGLDYSQTLDAWSEKFATSHQAVRELGYDERFIRSWAYYLGYAEAAFDHGLLTAAQITMSRATQRSEEGYR